MDNKRFFRKILLAASLIAMLLFGFWAWGNRWEVYDRWVARSYVSTTDSSEVLNNLDLTEKGDLVYRASLTEVDGKESFKERCPVEAYEEASVLGCYSARRIYILKVDEPRLAGVEEVTAAHELLHAKFERMSSDEREQTGKLLNDLANSVTDKEIKSLTESYKKALGVGEDFNNELFAIYGTQLEDVGKELEALYSEYFKDRKGIVERYKSYSAEFKRVEDAIKRYDGELEELRSEKDALEAELEDLDRELSSQKATLDQLQFGDSAEEYQRAAAAYNVKVAEFNAKVNRIREIIDEYNSLVEKRNSEALSAKSLADELNANIEER